jgi:hypothetical protein
MAVSSPKHLDTLKDTEIIVLYFALLAKNNFDFINLCFLSCETFNK